MPVNVNFGITMKIGDNYVKVEVGYSDIPIHSDTKIGENGEVVKADVDYELLEQEAEKALNSAAKVVARKIQAVKSRLE